MSQNKIERMKLMIASTDINIFKLKILMWNGKKNIPSQRDRLSDTNLVDVKSVETIEIMP